MKISCIIPTKDRCDLVRRAIDSALSQEDDRLEVVVVDDGSVDGTEGVVRTRYPEVRFVRLTGVGQGLARNAGAAISQGDVLMFLDSDDVWLSGHVEDLVTVLGRRDFSVAYGTAETVDKVNGSTFLIPEHGKGPEGDCFAELVRWCFMVPSATAVRREAFMEVGGFISADIAEDWAFFLQLSKRFPFGFAGSHPITQRYLHKGSLCCLADKETIILGLRVIEEVLQDLEPDGMDLTRISCMKQWTQASEEEWSTVQEWYIAMKKGGMV